MLLNAREFWFWEGACIVRALTPTTVMITSAAATKRLPIPSKYVFIAGMLKRVPKYVNNKRTLASYLILLFINTLRVSLKAAHSALKGTDYRVVTNRYIGKKPKPTWTNTVGNTAIL
jgi:hypothetical protein